MLFWYTYIWYIVINSLTAEIPSQRAQNEELWYRFIRSAETSVEQTVEILKKLKVGL